MKWFHLMFTALAVVLIAVSALVGYELITYNLALTSEGGPKTLRAGLSLGFLQSLMAMLQFAAFLVMLFYTTLLLWKKIWMMPLLALGGIAVIAIVFRFKLVDAVVSGSMGWWLALYLIFPLAGLLRKELRQTWYWVNLLLLGWAYMMFPSLLWWG